MAGPPQPVEKTSDPIFSQIGGFGRYQFWFCALVFLSKFGSGWHTLGHIFLAAPTPLTCNTPNVDDPCSSKCNDTSFDTSTFESTIIIEWNLTCKRANLASVSQSLVMAGIMIGSIIFGVIADRFGRRPAFLIACFMQLTCGLIACISPFFWFYCLFRFLTAAATGAMMTVSFVLIMEITGPKRREMVAILYQIPFNIGHASLAVFAYYIRTWRWFQFSITIFSAVFVIYICLVPESPRWLFTTGKLDKSISILEKMAKTNNVPVETIRGEIEAKYKEMHSKEPPKKGSLADLCRTPYIRQKTILMAINWIVICMVYYGTAQYISKLGGNIFKNNLIAAALGIPGTVSCVFMTKFFGRKITYLISNALSAIGLLALVVFLNYSNEDLHVIGATVALFGASITFPNAYLWGGEIFPTVVRSIGMGICSMLGRGGSLIAPFITDLSAIQPWLPPLIFGIASIVAIVGSLFIPETRGTPLPETLEDGENFGRKKDKD